MAVIRLSVLSTLMIVMSCAARGTIVRTPIEAPPARVAPAMAAATPADLAVTDVVSDAIDGEALARLLDDAGFEGGVERSFIGDGDVRRAEVRIVRFADARGADRYLEWLRTHDDVIGDSRRVEPDTPIPPGAVVALHEPGGCCPKETNVVMVSWRAGRDVVRVVVLGPAARPEAAADLALAVHRWKDTLS